MRQVKWWEMAICFGPALLVIIVGLFQTEEIGLLGLAILLMLIGGWVWLGWWLPSHFMSNITMLKQIMDHKRHDGMNDIQVMMSYVKMEKYDRLQSYLHRLTLQAQEDHKLAKSSPLLAMTLLTLGIQYPQWSWQPQLSEPIQIPIRKEKRLLPVLQQIFSWLHNKVQNPRDGSTIQVFFDPGDQRLQIRLQLKDEMNQSIPMSYQDQEWNRLERRLGRRGIQVVRLAQEHGIQINYPW